MRQKEKQKMKTQNLRSEQNGVTIAIDVGEPKAVYVTPRGLAKLLDSAFADFLREQVASVPSETLAAIQERADMTPEAREAKRKAAALAAAEAKVAAAKTDDERSVAELELQLLRLKQK